MKPAAQAQFALASAGALDRIGQLERQIERERTARMEAEAIAERGLRDLYENQRRLTLLQHITEAANRADDVASVLEFAAREICCHMGWEFGNAYLANETGTAAVAAGCWFAAQPDHLFALVEASRHASFKACFGASFGAACAHGDDLPGEVMRSGQAVWVDDLAARPGMARAAVALGCGLASACAFPIPVGDRIAGVLEFFTRKTISSQDHIAAVMDHIAMQLGRVIERDAARKALLHDAFHDNLTGLANRVLLAERARLAAGRLRSDGTGMALLVIDLDGFKAVNDRFGHQAGDLLLKQVAQRLRAAITIFQEQGGGAQLWSAAMIARVGGDEFVALIEGVAKQATLDCLAEHIHASLSKAFAVGAEQASIGASIGIAASDHDHREIDLIMRNADLAMYAAKAQGRGTTIWFTDELGASMRSRALLEQELREAIAAHQFVLHYQPIVDLDQPGRIMGFEALVRWQHPGRGLLMPSEFVPQAEESGLIIFIGDWVLEAACRAMAALHAHIPPNHHPFISINIAPQQFMQPNFVERVRDVLMETGINPAKVRLEVTESVAISDAKLTARVLANIREWGVYTSLDDFGTGYASLSYLQKLPFDCLKIDRSFVAAIDDHQSGSIVRTILSLAAIMEMSVVAEGIEDPCQHRALRAMGCRLGQGYLFSRPLAEAEAFALVEQRASLGAP
ncbi:MAG: putative bifunctional diguanylate cyclase/phosphodiesterase [Erythrobacter sp.]